MPRKSQFTADEIVEAAYAIVKESGWEGLSVTAVAKKTKSSTMPIYSYFDKLEKLKDAVVLKGWDMLMEYEIKQYTGDVWVDQSIGYISFAMAEKKLFYCMFDGRNTELQRKMLLTHWKFLTESLSDYEDFKGLGTEQTFLIRYSRSMLTHGVATTVIADWGTLMQIDGMIENVVTASSHAILEGYKNTYNCKNKNIDFIDKHLKDLFEQKKLNEKKS